MKKIFFSWKEAACAFFNVSAHLDSLKTVDRVLLCLALTASALSMASLGSDMGADTFTAALTGTNQFKRIIVIANFSFFLYLFLMLIKKARKKFLAQKSLT